MNVNTLVRALAERLNEVAPRPARVRAEEGVLVLGSDDPSCNEDMAHIADIVEQRGTSRQGGTPEDIELGIWQGLVVVDEFFTELTRSPWPPGSPTSDPTVKVGTDGIRIWWGGADQPDLALRIITWSEVDGPS